MNVAGEALLKPGKERSLLRRHPWIYDTAIARIKGRPAAGDTVAVRAAVAPAKPAAKAARDRWLSFAGRGAPEIPL